VKHLCFARTITNRAPHALFLTALLSAFPFALSACEKKVESSKSTTTKVTETPEGTKKTTESTEKKVETEKKEPR